MKTVYCPKCRSHQPKKQNGPRIYCGTCKEVLWVCRPAPPTIREPLVRTG